LSPFPAFQIVARFLSLNRWRSRVRCSPGNADLSDEAAGVSNDGAKSENADIAASAGNGKRRAPNAERFPISSDQRDAI
jgi:hypothetical protein